MKRKKNKKIESEMIFRLYDNIYKIIYNKMNIVNEKSIIKK